MKKIILVLLICNFTAFATDECEILLDGKHNAQELFDKYDKLFNKYRVSKTYGRNAKRSLTEISEKLIKISNDLAKINKLELSESIKTLSNIIDEKALPIVLKELTMLKTIRTELANELNGEKSEHSELHKLRSLIGDISEMDNGFYDLLIEFNEMIPFGLMENNVASVGKKTLAKFYHKELEVSFEQTLSSIMQELTKYLSVITSNKIGSRSKKTLLELNKTIEPLREMVTKYRSSAWETQYRTEKSDRDYNYIQKHFKFNKAKLLNNTRPKVFTSKTEKSYLPKLKSIEKSEVTEKIIEIAMLNQKELGFNLMPEYAKRIKMRPEGENLERLIELSYRIDFQHLNNAGINSIKAYFNMLLRYTYYIETIYKDENEKLLQEIMRHIVRMDEVISKYGPQQALLRIRQSETELNRFFIDKPQLQKKSFYSGGY